MTHLPNHNESLFSFLPCPSFLFYDLLILCTSALSPCTTLFQKRASDSTMDDCEPPCGYWELNPDPLEKEPVLFLNC